MKGGRSRTREHQFIHTRRQDESGIWYALDNAGTIMPSVTDDIVSSLFRFEAELDAPVDIQALREALKRTVRRMPYFNVRLRRGIFWYYFEQCSDDPPVFPDSPSPCQQWDIRKAEARMFRTRASGSVIAVEFSHALTDGTGGLTFFKTLLANYFLVQGVDPGADPSASEWKDILLEGRPSPQEFEDAYQRYFPKGLPAPDQSPKAFHLQSKLLPRGTYRVISGELSTQDALKEARHRGVSLTELLTAVYLDTLQQLWLASPVKESSIAVEVPINLRLLFPSPTMRNFSLFVIIKEDMRLGARSFDELVKRTHYQMKLEYDRMSIAKHLSRNAGSARNLAVRLVPLVVKDLAARMLFSKFGESMLSGWISNIGQVTMPPGFASRIERFGFIPAPSRTTMTNASVISWGDRLVIAFGSLAESRDMERLFFTRLRQLGLTVSVRCRLD
ncbi:MAG: hypothetical protein QHH01_00910, partial [Spirochaetales bacterium]|nr:hypothetical protein [Spirochaetales bacterium]